MDSLKDELEQAVPHVDPGPDPADDLVAAGRRAVRRRRARVGGLLAGGGLVAASLAVGAPGVLAPDEQRQASDPTPTTAAPHAPRPAAPAPAPAVRLTLEDVLEVHASCGRQGDPERTDEARGYGWEAVEFVCGDATVRVLVTEGARIVDRWESGEEGTLARWGEATAEDVGR